MTFATNTQLQTTVAARVAGEDIVCGDFIAVLNEIVELPSFLWSGGDVSLAAEEPVRTQYVGEAAGTPHKVVGVCLPFVYAVSPHRQVVVFDIRVQQIVRLDHTCAKTVWKKFKSYSQKPRK